MQWLEWMEKYEDSIKRADPTLAAGRDQSIPNLSSIMLLAEAEGKRIFLTGDGRWDHLLQGLEKSELLDPEGRLHVDVLKLPHHESVRNVSRGFFKRVTAEKYLLSANGKYGHPSPDTLRWIVEAARERGQFIEIFVTNTTAFTRALLQQYDPEEYGYDLTIMEESSHSMLL
jgi:beta-lactamase superfamily II metal-dependent hydrolase